MDKGGGGNRHFLLMGLEEDFGGLLRMAGEMVGGE